MGFFSSCDHDWSAKTKYGIWKTTYYHKCSKCGKEELCDSKSEAGGGRDAIYPACSKCGNAHVSD